MSQENLVYQGFTVLPLKVDVKSTILHYLYVRDHNVRDANDSKPRGRTLFVLNIPPYFNKEHIESLFCKCGVIQRLYLHAKPTAGVPPQDKSTFFPTTPLIKGYKVAYIVFKKVSAVKTALSLPYDEPLILGEDRPVLHTGLTKWCQDYKDQTVDVNNMQSEIDKYMAEFDQNVQEEIEVAKATEGVPDEEGWVTVTRYGKNKGAPRTEAHEKAITKKDKKRRKEKELLNFYSFQVRDSKKEQIATLRKKFEEDKQKIQIMKATRKFKPY